ncbi:NAD(P)-dependent oxidoreductase [Dyadobacter sp. NIV53]|uniref:NAD-dependent epimerase/dehydratase family protein n=1 Tax=Dyadobacter sp. NIV53 TaxID=2861765 RepID=UPI001C873A8B|nr:NAD(P)-dependent oxidoreductase [Dyadobacter sp. NIV53]
MNEKVLITGASGFIGHHLVQAALEKGYDVHAAVRPSSDIAGLKKLAADLQQTATGILNFVYPDFSSKESLLPVLEAGNYSYIIHAAGATRAKNTVEYNRVNAEYTLHLAQASLMVSVPLKRFVFMSSLAAIGPVAYTAQAPITENTVPKPVTSYGNSKLLAENYLADLKELPLTIIRPTAVFGPREKDIFILFETLSKGLDLYIGRKPQWLSFVFVKDLVGVTMSALQEEKKGRSIYNISDGQEYDRYALANLFNELSGKSPFRLHLPLGFIKLVASVLETFSMFSKTTPVLNKEKVNELTAANWYCSIEAARNGLHYEPQYNLRKGLSETLAWYKENNWL